MSQFLTKLQLEVADNTDDGKWVLTAALIYQSDVAKRTFVVPKGFQTDLASVPRLPVIFLLTGDTSNQAAAVHDYLYSSHEVSREMADAVLREASEVTGVPAWRRWLMWAGVRAGGALHWEPAGT
ncbi:DUF1353 domain-containing protein [Duganella sp. BJB475]|uniref:DUF1353 domain-containing protein n=1 Tax=Duganella sp. BJB475 TaxID=2233914 RepID=UPI000E3553EE|nr:DUF1353 domain-containing protein [Duganella sp. BJB475]RFP19202.1 DUF1353 domain-containing protein [Duganella sp. BJB475]